MSAIGLEEKHIPYSDLFHGDYRVGSTRYEI